MAFTTTSPVNSDTPQKYTTSGIVKLYVGKKRKRFEIHKDLLIAKSTYFKKAFEGNWEEARTGDFYWDDEKVEFVDVLVDWLYKEHTTLTYQYCIWYVDCYALGEKRAFPAFKNDVMDAFNAKYFKGGWHPSPESLAASHKSGLGHTQMHQYLLQSVVQGVLSKPNEYPEKATDIRDLVKTLEDATLREEVLKTMCDYHLKPWKNPQEEKACKFHDHSDSSSCGTKEKQTAWKDGIEGVAATRCRKAEHM